MASIRRASAGGKDSNIERRIARISGSGEDSEKRASLGETAAEEKERKKWAVACGGDNIASSAYGGQAISGTWRKRRTSSASLLSMLGLHLAYGQYQHRGKRVFERQTALVPDDLA